MAVEMDDVSVKGEVGDAAVGLDCVGVVNLVGRL